MKIVRPKAIRPESREAIEQGVAPDSYVAKLLVNGIIDFDSEKYEHYSPIYRMTNEPFECYLKKSDIEGKDVLTVAGSGDFLTWIIQNDPASVSTFDINIFTDYYQSLKMGALLTLDYYEYLDFFYGDNIFDERYFEKVLSFLPKHVQEFWSSLINFFEPNELLDSRLFVSSISTIEKARKFNSFLLNEETYRNARKAAYKMCYAFHNLPFDQLGEIKRKFDTIFLSNIVDYQNYCTSFEAVTKLRTALEPILKEDGTIIASTLSNKDMPNYISTDASIRKANSYIYELRVKPCKR